MKTPLFLKRTLIPALGILLALAMLTPVFADVAADGKIVVVIDPGHGGVDGGTDLGSRLEKDYDLDIAYFIKAKLEENGSFAVFLTREDDRYIKYLPRALFAREKNADLLLSVHCNSNTESYVNGVNAITSVVEKSSAASLADKIVDSISSATGLKRRRNETREDTGDSLGIYYWDETHQWDMPSHTNLGKKSDYFSMTTWSSKFGIPSIIVEHGYLSNPSDRAFLDSSDNLKAMAEAEAQAIIDYYTNHEHVFIGKTVDMPSSCTLVGTRSERCTVCGAKSGTETLPEAKENHFWRAESYKAASCAEEGKIAYICQISHNLSGKGFECEVHRYTETLAKLAHSGKVGGTCTVCGQLISEIPAPPTDTSDTAETQTPPPPETNESADTSGMSGTNETESTAETSGTEDTENPPSDTSETHGPNSSNTSTEHKKTGTIVTIVLILTAMTALISAFAYAVWKKAK